MSLSGTTYVCSSCRRIVLRSCPTGLGCQRPCPKPSNSSVNNGRTSSSASRRASLLCARGSRWPSCRSFGTLSELQKQSDYADDAHDGHNQQRQTILSPTQLLQQLNLSQTSTNSFKAYGRGIDDVLSSVEADISQRRQQDALVKLLGYASSQRPEKRQQLCLHRRYMNLLAQSVHGYMYDAIQLHNIQLSPRSDGVNASERASAFETTSRIDNSRVQQKTAHGLLSLLQQCDILTLDLHLELLRNTLYQSIKLWKTLGQEKFLSLASDFCTEQVLHIWASLLFPPTARTTGSTEEHVPSVWSRLPSPEQLEDKLNVDRRFGDYLGALLPANARDLGSKSALEMAAILTLYIANVTGQMQRGLSGPDVPLFSFLQAAFDRARPDSPPTALLAGASREHGRRHVVYADVLRHFGWAHDEAEAPASALSRPHLAASRVESDTVRALAIGFNKRAARAAERRDAKLAGSVFRSVADYATQSSKEGALPLDVYEHLIRMFIEVSHPREILQVLKLMKQLGLSANNKILTTVLRHADKLHQNIPVDTLWRMILATGVQPDSHAWSARIFALLKSDQPDEVMKALEELRIETMLRQQDGEETGDTNDPQHSPWKPNIAVANAALVGFANHQSTEPYIPQVLAWINKMGLKPDITTYNTLINIAMRKSADEAFKILERMRERGVNPDSNTATVVVNSFFHTDLLDHVPEQEWTEYLLSFLDDVEHKQVGVAMSAKGYTIALSKSLLVKRDLRTGQALLRRMQMNKIEITAQHYTILMDFYLSSTPPLYEAFESLWTTIQDSSGGYGLPLDNIFCDRALERMAEHHRILGLDKIQYVLGRMTRQGLRPSWPALQSLARIYQEREDTVRLAQLVDDIQSSRGIFAHGASKAYGQSDFWNYIVNCGVVVDESIVRASQLMIKDDEWRGRRRKRS